MSSKIHAFFKKHTLLLSMTSYGTLWTAADICEQKFIKRAEKHNPEKTARMAFVGSLIVAPQVYGWLRIMDRFFPGRSIKVVVKKLLVDQTIFPWIGITTFYTSTSILERKSFIEIKEELQQKFFPTWRNNIMFWPVVQVINFLYLPPYYRVPYISCASFIWSMYLSYMKDVPTQHHSDVAPPVENVLTSKRQESGAVAVVKRPLTVEIVKPVQSEV